jgi:DNA-binding transcriptional MerR regulator
MTQAANVYLLKDLARLSGHSTHTLKFYLKIGLIKEIGRSQETRFRYFDDSTLDALARIREGRRAGRRLAEIAADGIPAA